MGDRSTEDAMSAPEETEDESNENLLIVDEENGQLKCP